jgi:NAD(P)-dependent dehydrogenase (short-subunit alcohol dehydrogenase family)
MQPPQSTTLAVAAITGGSAGLGLEIARAFQTSGYAVVVIGRDQGRLDIAAQRLADAAPSRGEHHGADHFMTVKADLSDVDQVRDAFLQIQRRFGRLDVLVNNIGSSDRGTIANLEADHLIEIVGANVVPTLLCSQAALPLLEKTRGVVINIGSLAAKVGARYLGAYPAAKHALAGLTQQMRLEWKDRGVHVALVNPGPIQRPDAGSRYAGRIDQDGELPDGVNRPGGGTSIRGLPPRRVADVVLRMVRRRQIDCMLPASLRPLVAVGNLYPPLGDWLLLKFTKSKP